MKKHILKNSKLSNSINKNTINISYSCMDNIKQIITKHNKKILNKHNDKYKNNSKNIQQNNTSNVIVEIFNQ